MNSYAPIVVFAFNRPEHLKKMITSLKSNEEIINSDLFIFVDGARDSVKEDAEKVYQVQEYVKTITGFKSITYSFAPQNKGLEKSIIDGVSQIINRYGKVIVLEDDLILTKNCISYLNQGLDRYETNKQVFSICGCTNKVDVPLNYKADSYFCTRSSPCGWAMWSDRWNSIDWTLDNFDVHSRYSFAFNKWGGSDCWRMLKLWKVGKIDTWDIPMWFSQFLQNKVSLFPIKSFVENNGFEGDGTNCRRWTRFKYELEQTGKKEFVWPDTIAIEPRLYKEAMSYHGIVIRIWSRVMYVIYDCLFFVKSFWRK